MNLPNKCKICQKPIPKTRVNCSMECMKIDYSRRQVGKQNPNYQGGKCSRKCEVCFGKLHRAAKGVRCVHCWDKSGTNNPFYGKKHTNETIQKFNGMDYRKVQRTFLGKKHSVETKHKLSKMAKIRWETISPEEMEKFRQSSARSNDVTKINPTKPELMIMEILTDLGIKYEYNKFLYDKFYVDFFLPETNRVIEMFGDYWHANFIDFPIPNKRQVKQQTKDRSRIAYLNTCGHNVLVIWENRGRSTKESYAKIILESIPKK